MSTMSSFNSAGEISQEGSPTASELFGGMKQLVDNIGRKVYTARINLDISEETLAREVGVEAADVVAIENGLALLAEGKKLPPRRKVLAVLSGLSLTLDGVLLLGRAVDASAKDFWKGVIKTTSSRVVASSTGRVPGPEQPVTEIELEIYLRQKALDEICTPEVKDTAFLDGRLKTLGLKLGSMEMV